jgi:16S rRNA (guanine527-N7)-methyltransferase
LAERLAQEGVDAGLARRLGAYGAMLLEATRTVNLTAARTTEALAPHLLDALSLVPFVRGELVDVGSGGGLPGIPLALATGEAATLIEAAGKKADFLRNVLSALGLRGAVHTGRAEMLAHDPGLRERFGSATARAVGTAPTVAELTVPFLVPGGVAVLQRGSMDERERRALADAALMLGGTVSGEHELGPERRIVIVEKQAPTAGRFPRRNGVPAKRPLCYG